MKETKRAVPPAGSRLVGALAAVLLAAAGVARGQALSLEAGVPPHPGLDRLYRQIHEGHATLDAEKASSVYADDAFWLSPGRELRQGRPLFKTEHADLFEALKKDGGKAAISFKVVDRRAAESMAADVGVFTLETSSGGKTSRSEGQFTLVFARMRDGSWRIRVDSRSPMGGQAPARAAPPSSGSR